MRLVTLVLAASLVCACGDDDEVLPDSGSFAPRDAPRPEPTPDASVVTFADAAPVIDVQLTITGPTEILEGESGVYTVTLTGAALPAGATVTVTMTTGPGVNPNLPDATGSLDYELIDPIDSDVVFSGGGATMQTRTIPTVDDGDAEGDEDFLVALQNPRASAPNIHVTVTSSGIVGVLLIDNDS